MPRAVARIVGAAVLRGLVLAALGAALLTVSVAAAAAGVMAAGVGLLAWPYRRRWPVNLASTVSPAATCAAAFIAHTVLPLGDTESAHWLGIPAALVAGIWLGTRHLLEAGARRVHAGPAVWPLLVFGASLLAVQFGAFLHEVEMTRYALVALGGTSALASAFFVTLMVRGPIVRHRALAAPAARAVLLLLAGAAATLAGTGVPTVALSASGGEQAAQRRGLRPGVWTGSLDPERKAAAIAKVRVAEVTYACSDVTLRVFPDGTGEIQGGFSCTIVFSDNRRRGEILSSRSTYESTYAPAGRSQLAEIPVSQDIVRQVFMALSRGRDPRVTKSSAHHTRPARVVAAPGGDALWLYAYNGADAIAVVPWRLHPVEAAAGPPPGPTPGPSSGPVPAPSRDPAPTHPPGGPGSPLPGSEPSTAPGGGRPVPRPEPGSPPGAGPADPPDPLDPLGPGSYVSRSAVAEAAEEVGLLTALLLLIGGMVSSVAIGIAQGASSVAGAAAAATPGTPARGPATPPRPAGITTPGRGPAPPGWPLGLEDLLDTIEQRRIEFLASGGGLPEVIAGEGGFTPWAGDKYRSVRRGLETVERASQRNARGDDIFDPTRLRQQEVDEWRDHEIARGAVQALRAVRALAGDWSGGLWEKLTGVVRAGWDVLGPDPTETAEDLVAPPPGEMGDLVERWRGSQGWVRRHTTQTPTTKGQAQELIAQLLDERYREQIARKDDEEYLKSDAWAEYWEQSQTELRHLRALADWLP